MTDAGGTFHDLGPQNIGELGQRRVQVYVPASAERPTEGWRVLYMLDGQNVFGDEGSFAGGWHAHEAVEKIAPHRVHVPLIVSIDNGQAQRFDELTPWKMEGKGGKAEVLANWMADTLVPRIVKDFGGLSGPIGSVICGSSLGGLFALYAHHRRPDAFGGCIAMSSSLFWARRKIFDFVAKEPVPWTSRIYLDAGGREAGGRLATLTQQMAELLQKRGYGPDRLKMRIDARGGHNERAWAKRLPGALRFMYQHEQPIRRRRASPARRFRSGQSGATP